MNAILPESGLFWGMDFAPAGLIRLSLAGVWQTLTIVPAIGVSQLNAASYMANVAKRLAQTEPGYCGGVSFTRLACASTGQHCDNVYLWPTRATEGK